jgi:4'-phosphopantetheinyl transferase
MMSPWPSRSQPVDLGNAEAHLWVVALDLVPERLPDFRSILSPDERARAGQFLSSVDARRYMAARASLRSLLGAYVETEPGQLRFTYDRFGKPGLGDGAPAASVRFSVSHSADLGLFGFVREHRIGVDVERVREDIDVENLAKGHFSPNEFQKLRALSSDRQLEAFFCCWTRKEAYLKGRGEGVSYGLDRVEVSLSPGEPAAVVRAFDDPDVSRHWILEHLAPAPGYLGAAAVETGNVTFQCFQWEIG